MKLNDNEFGIGTLCCKGEEMKDSINITKEALEKLRDHYLEVAEGYNLDLIAQDDASTWRWGFYTGKAAVLSEILEYFEEE